MTPTQWQRVRDLFEEAIDREPGEVTAWLVAHAADDAEVRDEVLSLLAHHSNAGSFLSDGLASRVSNLLEDVENLGDRHDGDEVDRTTAPDAQHGAGEPLAAGTVVGAYTIARELGRGGMGRVYLATDARLGRTVALKALSPQFTRDPVQRERLRREARAAAALAHPGICTVYTLEEWQGDLFIVSEYVDGHTLREEISGGRPPAASEILQTARELAAALASAHAKGITHRDLKPENVMRTVDGRVKVLDFGLARMTEPEIAGGRLNTVTQPGMLVGTPAYMAPEQLNGQPADARADVFAFGVLMYEYACGVHPFDAATPLALIARVLESDARPIGATCPAIPASVAAAIDRCLQKVPALRFSSAIELAGALTVTTAPYGDARPRTWWRTHQLSMMGLYVVASGVAWQVKEYLQATHGAGSGATALLSLSVFVAIGIGSGISGIVRGHLVFTEVMNARRIDVERRRTDRVTLVVDLLLGAALLGDGLLLAATEPLMTVLISALALGIALARVLMEPATTEAAF
jgi:predicted Ser/Thr protein kinase